MGKTLLLIGFIVSILLFGCVNAITDARALIKFNEDGTGNVTITFMGDIAYDSSIDSQLRTSFGSKSNFSMQSSSMGGGQARYIVSFNLTKPTDLTKFSRFTNAPDLKYGIKYTYDDIISFSTIAGTSTGTSQSFSNFQYCVHMPGVAINYMTFDGREYPQYYGNDTACVSVDGSSTNNGQSLHIESGGEERKGCQYNNPSCDSTHDCINGNCVLKKGCDYNNPPCDDSHNCLNNVCALKPGCKYDNPRCDYNHTCQDNTCVLKPGCQYGNPPCDENHSCTDEVCILKTGCKYDNPKCGAVYEQCNTNTNQCEFRTGTFILWGFLLLLAAIVAAVIYYDPRPDRFLVVKGEFPFFSNKNPQKDEQGTEETNKKKQKDEVRDAEIEEKSAKVETMKGEQVKGLVKIKCLKCKALNDEDSEFCRKCGKKL